MNKILYDLVQSLQNHNVFILLINPPENISDYYNKYENARIITKHVKPGDHLSIQKHLAAAIDKYDIDIATNVMGGGQIVGKIILDACKDKPTKTVLRIAGAEIDAKIFIRGNQYKYSKQYLIDSATQLSNLHSCDRIVVMSKAEKKRIISFVNNPDKIIIAPRGIDTDYFDCDLPDFFTGKSNKMNILYLGRDSREKGADIAFDVVEASRQLELDTVFNFAGNFSESIIEKYETHSNINFLGYLSGEEIKQAIKQNDLMILPSRLDALPQSLLECMSSRRVCIVPTHLFSDLLDNGKNGFVCRLEASAFLNKIRDIQKNPKLGIKMCNAARNFISNNFDMKNCSTKYEQAVVGDLLENS